MADDKRCQCLKVNGKQCQRESIGESIYCGLHLTCKNSINPATLVPVPVPVPVSLVSKTVADDVQAQSLRQDVKRAALAAAKQAQSALQDETRATLAAAKQAQSARQADKPTKTASDGTQYWYHNGELHREGDKPAIMYPNGHQEWYRNGKLHREGDKPAVIYTAESQEWYHNGQLHREGDKPAIMHPNGHQEWYRNGKLHREGDKPAVVYANGNQYWYRNGQLHREGDGPAKIVDGNQYWYHNDRLHREGDKPAIVYADGRQEWYRNGQRHREGDDPAMTVVGNQYWYRDGQLHRGEDKPAIVYANGRQEWYRNDQLHREGDKPAVVSADGSQEWYRNGKLHREGDKPAVVSADGSQDWYRNGRLHRDGDNPAVVFANGQQEWFINGQRHREGDKPAMIFADGRQDWFYNGKLHRVDGPAVIFANGRQQWYINDRPLTAKEEQAKRQQAERAARQQAERTARQQAERTKRQQAEKAKRQQTERAARQQPEKAARQQAEKAKRDAFQETRQKFNNISPAYLRTDCLNAQLITGDETTDVAENKYLYVSRSGHCFNIEEELLPLFQLGNFKNPYTGILFTPDEMEEILQYPHYADEANRTQLRGKLNEDISDAFVQAIRAHPEVFREIYLTGYKCFIDYTDKYQYSPDMEFYYASEAIAHLHATLEGLPATVKKLFTDLQYEAETLGDILRTIKDSCIHQGGSKLMMLFLGYYHRLPEEAKPNISDLGIIPTRDDELTEDAQKNTYICLFNTENAYYGFNFIMLFIYDEHNGGRGNHFGYLAVLKPNNSIELYAKVVYTSHAPRDSWKLAIWQSHEANILHANGALLRSISSALPRLPYNKPLRP